MKGFTNTDLMNQLKEKLENILRDKEYEAEFGGRKKINFYLQDLPYPKADDDSDLSQSPYCVIKYVTGTINSWDSVDDAKRINIILLFCTYSKEEDVNGGMELLEIIQKIENYFGVHRHVGNFQILSPFTYKINEDDTTPYHYGAVSMNFEAPRTVIEDELT